MVLSDYLTTAGGAERLAGQIAMRLDPERFRRTLCITRWSDEQLTRWPDTAAFKRQIEDAGVELLLVERGHRFDFGAMRPLWKRLRDGSVDVLHAHKHGSNFWAATLGSAARVPVVIAHEHTWSFEGQPARRLIDREVIARGSDAFLAVSRRDRERMIEVERIPPDDVVFVPNGIAGDALVTDRDLRAELGIAPDAPVIGAVAVLRPQKALDRLIRAAASLRQEFPGLKLLLAGDGPEREVLEGLIGELDMGDAVHMLGMRTDVAEVLATFDVGVLSSDFEGSPLAVMEYMAAGLPVVATRVGGVPDLVEDGVSGVLVEPGGPEALAEGIATVLRSPDRGREMGRRGRERQREEFELDVMIRRLEELYETLLASKRNGGGPARRAPRELSLEPVPSLDAARPDWERLAETAGTPFATWEWADAWWRTHGAGVELKLSACRSPGGETVAMLPLYLRREKGVRMLRFLGHGPADQLGPVCAREDAPEVAWALRRAAAADGDWDVFVAERLARSWHWADWIGGDRLRTETSPYLHFEGGWEEYLASRSSNFRQQVRRAERALERDHHLHFRLADDPARLGADMTTLIDLHYRRFAAAGETRAFEGNREAFHRDFAARALERGWLRLWFLELDGRPVAAWYGFRYGGAEWFYQSGRDPAYDREKVGFVLLAHTIRSALDDGVHTYHLLRGDEAYKSRVATATETLDTVVLAATARGRMARRAAERATTLPPQLRRLIRSAAEGER